MTTATDNSQVTDDPFEDMRMNPEVKAKWLAALESGKYKQGKNKLRRILPTLFNAGKQSESAERWCCLGVLCNVYIEDTGKGRWEKDSDGEFKFFDGHDDWHGHTSYGMPTAAVYQWAGLADYHDKIFLDSSDKKKFTDGSLAELNDEGRTFKTIIGVIKKYL